MQKNKTLPLFLMDSAPKPSELNALSLIDVDRVVVFGLYGIEESFKMEAMLDEKLKDKVFFVHMSQSAFLRAKAKDFSDRVDFSFYHFFYDIFKVPKFKFKQANFTHFSWVEGLDLDKMKSVINKITLENKPNAGILYENPDIPVSGGTLKVSEFEKIMDQNIFGRKGKVVSNGN